MDGKIQSSEMDEFIYHEALTHPPMITHPHPETVFIAGGGEGATLREVLAHTSVKRAVMVDIDEEAVDICRRFLPFLSQGSFEDDRAELLYLDAREYLAESEEKFDYHPNPAKKLLVIWILLSFRTNVRNLIL